MCEIERYCNIPHEQRLCRWCKMNKVESERHFIFECICYSDLRNQLLDQLTKDRNLHLVRHMYSLLSSPDPANWLFLFKALEKRNHFKVYASPNESKMQLR